jgi:hypothetical protein
MVCYCNSHYHSNRIALRAKAILRENAKLNTGVSNTFRFYSACDGKLLRDSEFWKVSSIRNWTNLDLGKLILVSVWKIDFTGQGEATKTITLV